MPPIDDGQGSGQALQGPADHRLSPFARPDGALRDIRTLDTLRAVVEQAGSEATPDAILATGDLAQEADTATYRLFLDTIRARFDAPLLCTPGNHDSEPLFSSALPVAPLTLGAWRLVGVDTHIEGETGGRVGARERQRLAGRIDAGGEHVLVAGHHSPTPIGVDWLDVHAIEGGDELLACLMRERAPTSSATSTSRSKTSRRRRLLGSPSTCFQFTSGDGFGVDDRPPGYRWLSLSADGPLPPRCTGLPRDGARRVAAARGFPTATRCNRVRRQAARHERRQVFGAIHPGAFGLEPVRRRPGMYTDTTRPNHLVQEVVDNSVDEVLAGFGRRIDVAVHADGSIEVTDDGRGMPVDMHPEHGVPGVELILTRLHAGGKFDGEHYNFAGGLHGVGVSVVNALSSWLVVDVKRDGAVYRQRYESGDP